MQYVDCRALVKRYVREPDSALAIGLLDADPEWVTSTVAEVEVRRVLAVRLPSDRVAAARAAFLRDWERMSVVAADATTMGTAASLAEATGARSIDALHVASARRVLRHDARS